MSKYQPLWDYVVSKGVFPLQLGFDDIERILGFPIDHSFLIYKRETAQYNFLIKKISTKAQTVVFDRLLQ